MHYLFELSKEHKTIPKAEIISCLKAENVKYDIIEENEDTVVLSVNTDKEDLAKIFNRLSFCFFVDRFLFSCSPKTEHIKKYAESHRPPNNGSIAIRYKNRSKTIDSQGIVKLLADVYSKDRHVNLDNPDIEIRAIVTNSKIYVGKKIFEIDRHQFEKRKVQNRPFFSPISLHPKIARALVNLSCISKGETLLDPFCGTGGILIESGLMGVTPVGSDIEEKMVKGCKRNLEYYKIKNYNIYNCDIGEIKKKISNVDAIVTDMPYGKSATTKGEEINKLYGRAFESMNDILKHGKRAVVGLSNEELIKLGEKYFSLVEVHKIKAHKSLTRYFVVYEK